MSDSSLELDAVLDACQHGHRRIVLAVFANDRRAVTTNDLAKAIVERNHHAPPTEVASEAVTRIEISLHHVHLPRLEEAEFVEYDPERKLVTPTAQFDRGEPHLSPILDVDSGVTAA